MDLYLTFIEQFKRNAEARSFRNLPNIFKEGHRFLAIVSLEHRESVVCSIFDRSDGLLSFLDYEIRNRIKLKEVDDTLKEAFHFLTFFIDNFYTTPCFVEYIQEIKDVCQLALTVRCSSYVQKAARNAFIKLIKLFKDQNLKLVDTVKKFTQILFTYEPKERTLIFCVLGKIIKHNESVRSLWKYWDKIIKLLISDASERFERNDHTNFHMYFDALVDILDVKELLIKKRCDLYKWIKYFSQSDKQQNVKTLTKSAINLLCCHINLFQDLLYPDCMYWHDIIKSLSLEKINYDDYEQHALKKFYRVVGQILTDQNSQESKNILEDFLNRFYGEFEKTNLNLTPSRMIVYGFSQMAAPCKKHMTQFDVIRMYSTITNYALPLCSREYSDSTDIENVCFYQEALSEILHNIQDVTIEKVNVFVKFSVYVIKRFPDLFNNTLAISTLTKTIGNLAAINKGLLQRYLDNIVYDGVAWSCSHTLALDAELQRELNNLEQSPVCYKDYLPLWTELLNAERYRASGYEQLAQHVANTMMDVCITLINRLNIHVKRKPEDTVLSDVAFTQIAVNQTDFRVFANVVDLYVDVIDASEPQLFVNTVHRFLYEVVRLSYRYPLISGFYKLIRAGMYIFARTSEGEEEEEEKGAESQRMEELLSNYLWHALDLIPKFSNEILIACLYLILDAPFAYVKDALPRTLPMFKIAFTVGLSNLELAYAALNALEMWTTQKRDERTNELLRDIVAYLEPYLRNTESSVEVSQDLISTVRRRVKRVDVIDTECTLRNFQRRVLLFLGSLDHDLLTSFVHERASRSTGASWDHKNLFKYVLPLPDARLDIYFDRMLPRIIELARDSSDRRTKIAACEVLHSIVTVFIGFGRNYSNSEGYIDTLCRAVLNLGCDPDEVVCGLFHPLALQLMHWWSSKIESMSLVIDSLFDGLTDDSNSALREFSGMCLAVFTRKLIRNEDNRRHVHTIIERINNLTLHPSTRKRVAAAVAFNHLYVILSDDDDIVSIYWLEIFYCFVRSLDGCDNPSITNALVHIEKVMRNKVELLNTTDERRNKRRTHEFNNATLIDALYWLLSQCGTLDEHCRAKCMKLYVNMSQYVVGNPQEATQKFVSDYGTDRLNRIILKGLKPNMKDIHTANLTLLLKALDYYVWLIDKKLLPVEMLFSADNVDNQAIFSYICSFVQKFEQVIAESSIETAATVMRSRELEQLQALQCKVLMTTLNFVQVLLNVDVNVLESLWNESLCALIIRCIMHPRMVGFDVKNIEMMDKLPYVLETLLNSMRSSYSSALPNIFKKHLLSDVWGHATKLLNLYDIAQNDSCNDLIQHVNGLILLKRYDMLDQTALEMSAFANGDNRVTQIFNFLVNERIGEMVCRDLSARMIEYLRALMEFQFSLLSLTIETPVIIPDDVRSMIETLVRLMVDDGSVINVDCTKITHGEHFLNTFRSVIFKYMLTHVSTITLIFDVLQDKHLNKASFLLTFIEDLLLFLKQHRREPYAHVDATVNVILKQFTCLKNTVFNMDSRKEILINIYSIAVHLISKPTEVAQNHEFYQWIRDQLMDGIDLEYKTKILKNFFICLTDVTDRDDLQISLRTLRTNARTLCSNLSEKSVNAMKVINCFETLLMLLSTTRSMLMLKSVILFAAGTGNHLIDEKLEEHLRTYYYGASLEHVLESLQQTYRMFMEVNTTETERLDILHGFLSPAFKFCGATAIERFFKENIKDLPPDLHVIDGNDQASKQKIVSKIGYFQLMTIMFARIDKDKINANGTIAPSQEGQILIKGQLYQKLLDNTKNILSLRIIQSECQALMRQLHCSAYNCLLAMISLKEEERFYKLAFAVPNEEKEKKRIWENIIDGNAQYKLGQTFKDYPKTREITVNIRSAEVDRAEQQTHRYAYVHSYDLSTCTLSEDINAYDLNKFVVLPSDFHHSAPTTNSADSNLLGTHGATSIALKSNDFNEHECMPYICVLLRHFRQISKLKKPEELEWLKYFCGVMQHDNKNIQLFMLKIITNTADEVFKPYAKFVLTKIIKAVANYLGRHDLNYIITDILEILMDWHNVAVLSNEESKAAAQKLFEIFMRKVFTSKSNNNRVYNYNLYLMRTMVEKWHNYLRVPRNFLDQQIISESPNAVYLILMFLGNNMTKEIVDRDDKIVNFLLKLMNDWETDEMPLQCCECLGLYLRSLDNSSSDETERNCKKQEVIKKIFDILGSASPPVQKMIKQVKRIATLSRTYREVAVSYINVTSNAMSKCPPNEKSYCLEIFALAMPSLSAEDVMNNLRHMELQEILKKRMSCCEKALRIVRDMVEIQTALPKDLLLYVNLVIPYVKDNIREYRELVYDILMRIHKRFSVDITADDCEFIQNLLSVSIQNLLSGLLDPFHDLQDRILKFWTEETSLSTEKSKDRLIELLSMHSLRMITAEDAFTPFMALLMLQLASKSIDYTRKILDTTCNYEFKKYEIPVSWRRRNLSCVTPMFVDSLASQMSYNTLSQSVDNDLGTYKAPTFSYSRLSYGVPPGLRATQNMQFEPTLFDDNDAADMATTLDISSHNTGFDRTAIASSSRQSLQTGHERFTRILENTSNVANINRDMQKRKKMQRAEKIKQENIKQRSSVKLYRKYRIGEVPDIEISNESFIVPLQQLIKLDRMICKDVTVSLFCSLIKETASKNSEESDFHRIIAKSLKEILHNSCERNTSFNAVILETLQLSRDITAIANCDPRDVAKASKATHSNAVGVLLLERSLLTDAPVNDSSPTSSKKMRIDDDAIRNEETNKWAQLASLYKSLNDVDIVLSIFRGQQSFDQDVQKAALAEVDGDWIRAKNEFTNAYERITNPSIKEHCLQGLLDAANNLCDWSAIDQLVKSRTSNRDLSSIWNDTWRDQMIPYACDAYVHMSEERGWASSNDDVKIIQSWMDDRDKLQHLMLVAGENLILFLLNKDVKKATDLLNDILDMMGKQWVELSPLCTELGIRKLFKLQIINDLHASLKVLRSPNEAEYLNRIDALLNFWSMKGPTIRDNLVQWNKLAAYRTYSSTFLQKHNTERRLYQVNYQLRLGIVNAALNQKHRYIAKKHLNYISKVDDRMDVCRLEVSWLEARIEGLCADVETDSCTKMHNYTNSWKRSHKLLNKSNELDADMSTAIKEHIGTMASKIESLSREDDEFASRLTSNATILRDIKLTRSTNTDLDYIREHLLRYSLDNLRACCENTTAANVGKHYCALARHCYSRLMSTDVESDEIFKEFLLSTLKSMRHDYLEATHYFPCLLRPERLQDDEIQEAFIRECAELRPWLFLRWQDLLFFHLGTPSIATAIVPIIEKLAKTYPDAIVYNYHLTVERNPSILQDQNIQQIQLFLRDKAKEYERFLRAIEYVAQPEPYLIYYLDKAMRNLSRGETAIESLQKVYPNSNPDATERRNLQPNAIFEKIFKKIASYKNKIIGQNSNVMRGGIQELRKFLVRHRNERHCKNDNVRRLESKLKDYSSFLHEYIGGDDDGGIEIPGQYTGDREPMPRYHVRIARFEPLVETIRSLREPIRIGMVGNNGRTYKFLVKFGEDLTLDRGLQQLYSTMNRTLRNDPSCRQRRLAIDTYEVIPLSRSFGLIQWIENTKSLDDLIQFALSHQRAHSILQESIRNCNKKIHNNYEKWISNAAPKKQPSDQYKEAVSKYDQQTVTETMKSLIGETTKTALRDAFDNISQSPECFVTLRRNFVASYATMCVAHWLAGVGDRHLQNTLVHVATGRCLGIDFGHAFGLGIRASIPELVPFRLTPQILELLRPFTERDLLATIMTHTMRALRDDQGPILACMDIFVYKPTQRSSNIDDGNMMRNDDLTWSSKKNIEIVAKKLNGIHPSTITLKQLKEAHGDEYFAKYRDIINGNDRFKQERMRYMKSDRLTPTEQVICLLDQAKDFNILGRMYANWQPWL